MMVWTRLRRTSVPREWRQLAYRHRFYHMSAGFYAAAGLVMWHAERGRSHALPGEVFVCFVQTFLTHMSDVVTLGKDSAWHGLDRVHAYAFTAFRACYSFYAYAAWSAYSRLQAIVFAVGLAFALVCIALSWNAVVRRDAAGFFYWHALWHLSLPATATSVALLFDRRA